MMLFFFWLATAAAVTIEGGVRDSYDGIIRDCKYSPVLEPTSYDLTFDMDYGSRTFDGQVIITGVVRKRTTEIQLDSCVNVSSAKLLHPESERLLTWSENDSVLTLEFNQDLIPGVEYRILIQFVGNIRPHRGIYGTNYTAPDSIERYFIATEFQASFARYAFPCVDRPNAKANFRLNVSREASHVVISNTPLVHSRPSTRDNMMWDCFEETPKMSTYILAFAIGDFISVEGQLNNTVWIPKGWPRESANFALNLIPKFQATLAKLTGIPYFLPKLDHVALPLLNSVAMENWGMVTYKQNVLLTANKGSITDKLTSIFTLAHELAHQWFGNLVTCKSWGYTWLNEGITSYLQYKVAGEEFPEWDTMGFLISEELRSLMEDDGYSPMPLTNDSCQLIEANSFSLMSYYKGAAVIRMVEHILSAEELLHCLHVYLKENAYGSVDEDDLWEQFEISAQKRNILPESATFATLMKTWTNNDGLPLVTAYKDGSYIRLNQVPIDFFNIREGKSSNQSWWIPLTFTLSSKMDFNDTSLKVWLEPNIEMSLDLKLDDNEFAIFNIQQAGYYRVNYDNETWQKIIKQLHTDHTAISVINRAQLVDDVFTLAMLKYVNYTVSLSLATYLRDELDYEPWAAAIQKLTLIRIPLNQSSVLKLFDKFILSLLDKVYAKIPEDLERYEIEMINPRDRCLATKVARLACELKLKNCERRATLISKILLSDEENNYKMVRDLKVPLMCTMIRLGGQEIWDYAWEMFKHEKATKVKESLLKSLTCTMDKVIFKKLVYLEFGDEEESEYLNDFEIINHVHDYRHYCYIVEVISEIAEKNKTWLLNLEISIQSLSSLTFPKWCQDQLAAVIEANADVLESAPIILSLLAESAPYEWHQEPVVRNWLLAEMDQVNSVIETDSLYQDYYQRPDIEFPIQDYDGEKARAEANKNSYDNEVSSAAAAAPVLCLIMCLLLLT